MADPLADVQLIGDEIHFERELVALLTDNACSSVRQRFEDLLRFDASEEDETKHDDEKPEPVEIPVLDALWSKATDAAKGGLLRMGDLANIIAQLKDDK